MQFDHINISVSYENLLKVRDFYCQVFDLVDGERAPFHLRGFWLYKNEQAVFHLLEKVDDELTSGSGNIDHIAFKHQGLAQFILRLKQLDIEFHHAYIASLDLTQLFFFDPVGIKIEVNFYNERIA